MALRWNVGFHGVHGGVGCCWCNGDTYFRLQVGWCQDSVKAGPDLRCRNGYWSVGYIDKCVGVANDTSQQSDAWFFVGHVIHSLRFMPCGAIVCSVRIQASSSLNLMFLSFGDESMIVHSKSVCKTSWSRKCFATGESLRRYLMSRLCSLMRSASVLPVSPTYCCWQTGQWITYTTFLARHVLSPII